MQNIKKVTWILTSYNFAHKNKNKFHVFSLQRTAILNMCIKLAAIKKSIH